MEESYEIEYRGPHPGPQTKFLQSSAEIAVYGGQRGGGKSFALLLDCARGTHVNGYGAVIFRRTEPMITSTGGLWDESLKIYPHFKAKAKPSDLEWVFPNGSTVQLRGLQHDSDAEKWQGMSIPVLAFDELTHFTERQFFAMGAANRSTCGITPYIRGTCNPVPSDDPIGGWVHRFLQWWIDEETGFAIEKRSGVIRWCVRVDDEFKWGGSKQEMIDRYYRKDISPNSPMQPVQAKSVTFVPAKLSDNPTMLHNNPTYLANLMNLPEVERQRWAFGNWNAKVRAGTFFKVGKTEIVDVVPANLRYCRSWDLAHTDGDGDWTVGVKIGTDGKGTFYITDVKRGQWEAFSRDDVIKVTADSDNAEESFVMTRFPEDPSAGKSEAARLVKMVRPHPVKSVAVPRKNKEARASGFASQFNAGNVKLLKGPWNSGFLSRLDTFPTKDVPDDEVDAAADGFNELEKPKVSVKVGESRDPEGDRPENAKLAALVDDGGVRAEWERMIRDEAVHPRWKNSFAAFRDDMGPKPTPQHKLAVRDINDFWESGNCYWSDGSVSEPPIVKKRRSFVAD